MRSSEWTKGMDRCRQTNSSPQRRFIGKQGVGSKSTKVIQKDGKHFHGNGKAVWTIDSFPTQITLQCCETCSGMSCLSSYTWYRFSYYLIFPLHIYWTIWHTKAAYVEEERKWRRLFKLSKQSLQWTLLPSRVAFLPCRVTSVKTYGRLRRRNVASCDQNRWIRLLVTESELTSWACTSRSVWWYTVQQSLIAVARGSENKAIKKRYKYKLSLAWIIYQYCGFTAGRIQYLVWKCKCFEISSNAKFHHTRTRILS